MSIKKFTGAEIVIHSLHKENTEFVENENSKLICKSGIIRSDGTCTEGFKSKDKGKY